MAVVSFQFSVNPVPRKIMRSNLRRRTASRICGQAQGGCLRTPHAKAACGASLHWPAGSQRYERLRQGVKNHNGLVGAGDYGLGDSNEFVLLAEDTKARNRCSIAIELRGGAGRQFDSAGLDL